MKKIRLSVVLYIFTAMLIFGCICGCGGRKAPNDTAPSDNIYAESASEVVSASADAASADATPADAASSEDVSSADASSTDTSSTDISSTDVSSENATPEIATPEVSASEITFTVKTVEKDGITYFDNPLIDSIYTADPAPMVYGDTLYLYTTHDENELENNFYTMKNWHCYSTKDMVNWVDHGEVFSLDDILWADDRAWAAQAIERNDMFYLYCPVHKRNGGMAIAVGVSDSPTGPFKEFGFAVVNEGDWNDIDPTVFIDDDGQAYLYFGNPELRYVLLKESMLSYNKEIGVLKVEMTTEAFGEGPQSTGTTYAEGPWFYKRNGIYYMVYAAFIDGHGSEQLAYSTAPTATGPWTYQGILMTDEGGTFTNHPGIVDFNGHSYLFYHTQDLPGGSLFHRSVCVAEFTYNEDGTINTIEKIDYDDIVK